MTLLAEKEQWYSNKELYEMIDGLRDDLKDTTTAVKKYNGLHERFDKVEIALADQMAKCAEVQKGKEARSDIALTLLKIWPIVLSTVMAIWAIWGR